MQPMDVLPDFGVSILIPVYFRDVSVEKIRWLRRALESVRDQTFPESHEVLLIDDGSPTAISEHASELGAVAKEIRFLRLPRNGGIVGALNHGLSVASHPLIARLDADDAWCGGKCEKQLRMIAADPDLTITATGMTRVDEHDTVIDHHIRKGDWHGILRFFAEAGCPFPHGSVIARKDVYRLLGGYPHDAALRHCEDFALWGTWLRFFKPAMVEEALYRYTVARSSVSIVHGDQQARASRLVHERFNHLGVHGELPAALEALSKSLGLSLVRAGAIAYTMWRYGTGFALPEAALSPLSVILADRDVHVTTSPWNVRTVESMFPGTDLREAAQLVPVRATSNGG